MDDQTKKTRLIRPGNLTNALGEGQENNNTITFPLHRTLKGKWFPHRCRQWRRDRFLRPGAITPMPEDLREVV